MKNETNCIVGKYPKMSNPAYKTIHTVLFCTENNNLQVFEIKEIISYLTSENRKPLNLQ